MECRAVEKALVAGHTKLLMLESPTNPRMQICDIATLTQMAHQVGCASLSASYALLVPCFCLACLSSLFRAQLADIVAALRGNEGSQDVQLGSYQSFLFASSIMCLAMYTQM